MILNQIRESIEGESDDRRFEAWMQLYSRKGAEESIEINQIITGHDPILKVLFARFLARVYEDRAILYLSELLCDPNPVVVDIAIRSFDKNLCEVKLPKLIGVLDAPLFKAQKFAIEKLCQGNITEAIAPLIDKLKIAEGELLEHLLVSLRHIPDKRLMGAVKTFITHQNRNVRFHAIMVFGALYQAGYRECLSLLLAALSDNNPRVRQAVLWVLRRHPERRFLRHFLKMSRDDQDSNVRQEALLGLALFPRQKVVEHLLRLLVSDHDRMVVLKGEAVLLSISQKKLIRALKKVLHDHNFAVRSKAVLMLSEFHPNLSIKYYEFLMREIKKAKSTKEKMPFLQSLGIVGYAEAAPYLREMIHSSDKVLSYTAMVSLLKIYAKMGSFPILDLLKDESLSNLLRQMVMKIFVKQAHRNQYTDELMIFLLDYLKSQHINLRYLAARVLIASEDERFLEPLFAMILAETDGSIRLLLKEYVLQAVLRNPVLFLHMIMVFKDQKPLLQMMLEFFHEVKWGPEHAQKFISALDRPEHIDLMLHFPWVFADILNLLLGRGVVRLVEIIGTLNRIPGGGAVLDLMTQKLIHDRSAIQIQIDPSQWRSWLFGSGCLDKNSLLRFMALDSSQATLNVLMDVLFSSTFVKSHETVRQVLNQRVRNVA